MNSTALSCLSFRDVQFDVVDRNGQPWLRGLQVASALGFKNPASDIANLLATQATPNAPLTLSPVPAHTDAQVLETPQKALPRNVIAVFLCLIGFAPMGDGPVRKAGRTTFCVFRTSPAIAFESNDLSLTERSKFNV